MLNPPPQYCLHLPVVFFHFCRQYKYCFMVWATVEDNNENIDHDDDDDNGDEGDHRNVLFQQKIIPKKITVDLLN